MDKTTSFLWTLCVAGCFSDPDPVDDSTDGGDTEAASTEDTGPEASTTTTSDPSSGTEEVSTDSASTDTSISDTSESGEETVYGALYFNGDDEASTGPIAQATLPPEFTVELWVEVAEDPYFGFLIDTRTTDNTEGWLLLVDPPWWTNSIILNWNAEDGSGGHGLAGPEVNTLSSGWHHWAFTRDATGLVQCWIDGVALAEGPSTLPPASLISPLIVGRYQLEDPRAGLWWKGAALDDIHISNVARYTETFVPEPAEADTNSILLWHFDEGEGDVAIDEVSGIELNLSSPVWVEGH